MAPSTRFKDEDGGSGEEGKSPDAERGTHARRSLTLGQCDGDPNERAHFIDTTTY